MSGGPGTPAKVRAPAGIRRIASFMALALCACIAAATAHGQPRPDLAPDKTIVYKHAGDQDLHLWVWNAAAGAHSENPLGAVVLFHGGSFTKGQPRQLSELSKILANYGLLVVSVEYRLATLYDSDLQQQIEDARSSMRWMRGHAKELHIDPNRIAAGGSSAGGLLALSTAVFDDVNDPSDPQSVAAAPDALVLLNPVYSPDELGPALFRAHPGSRLFSAIEALKRPLPPTLIIHGTDDGTVRFQYAQDFVQKALGVGSRTVTLKPYQGRRHGFFGDRGWQNPDFIATTQDIVDFLRNLGWIDCAADCQVKRP